MKRLLKITLFLSALALGGFLLFGLGTISPALSADQMVLKIPSDQPPDGPNVLGWQAFKQYVESNSQGRIAAEIHHSAQLGDSVKVTEGAKMGVYQVVESDEGIADAYDPLLITRIPYLFRDEEVLKKFYKSQIFQEANNGLAKTLGLRILAGNPYGFYCIINKLRPITRLEDMKGLKLRVMPGSQVMIKTFGALGMAGTPISWTEIYTSIKTGVIDGVSQCLFVHTQQKFQEVAKNLCLDFSWAGNNFVLVNEKWWQSLPQDLKQVVQSAADIASIVETGYCTYDNRVKAIDEMTRNGVKTSVISKAEMQRIKDAAQKGALEYITPKVGKEAVERTLKTVREIEAQL